MRLFKATIEPQGAFASTLRGDTLFGQICWMIRYTLGEDRLKMLLANYDHKPFLIVSDAFAAGYLPKPKLPASLLGEDQERKKINRKKIWVTPQMLKSWNFDDAKSEAQATGVKVSDTIQIHNSLNYLTSRTDKSGAFAPYGVQEYYPGKKDIYLLIDEEMISADEIRQIIITLGKYGYGKDASIGKGRFGLLTFEESKSLKKPHKAYMTLCASTLLGVEAKALYYEPFTRFGKHGAQRAYRNAFKRALLLADSAAVIIYDSAKSLEYIGHAIRGVSKAYPDTVHQGYAITLPLEGLIWED